MRCWLVFGVSTDHPVAEDVAAVADASLGLALAVVVHWALATVVLRPRPWIGATALVCAAPVVWFWWDVSQMT